MHTIMIPVADRPECAVALKTAFSLADRLSVDVLGYHLRPHRDESTKGPSTKSIMLDSKAAKRLFDHVGEQHDIEVVPRYRKKPSGQQALWHELTGSPEKVFPIVGPMSDLIVVSRPSSKSSAKAKAFQSSALLKSGTPVLMLPPKRRASVGTRVLITWNQSIEAAATVKASLGLLKKAEAVRIIAAGREDGTGPKSRHLVQYLKHAGVNAKRLSTPGHDANKEIMGAYEEHNCDLLMMGAYSRSRWREMVFGGFTDYVINHSTVPALMLHR
ncbi:MAG: universal stress protein [Pseudomonadota bacterium]